MGGIFSLECELLGAIGLSVTFLVGSGCIGFFCALGFRVFRLFRGLAKLSNWSFGVGV